MRHVFAVALSAALASAHSAADSPLIVVGARASAPGSKRGSVLSLGPTYQALGAVDVGGELQSARALRYASEAKQLGDPRAEALLREIQPKH